MFNVETYTNIKFIDIENFHTHQFRIVKITNDDFERLIPVIERNRFESNDIIINRTEYNVDHNSIDSYFYITNEEQDVKYLFRKLDGNT